MRRTFIRMITYSVKWLGMLWSPVTLLTCILGIQNIIYPSSAMTVYVFLPTVVTFFIITALWMVLSMILKRISPKIARRFGICTLP